MAAQMQRVMPELQWVTIDVTHPVFHTFFDLKKIDYDHPMFPGMVPDYRALFEGNDPNGRMIALANHNNDLAEYWEWSDRGYFGIDPYERSLPNRRQLRNVLADALSHYEFLSPT